MTELDVHNSFLVPPVIPKPVLNARKSSKLKIDITVEKNKSGKCTSFGQSIVRLSGDLADKTVVTDHTIQINIPGENTVHHLNLIYDTKGQPNLPQNNRAGFYSLLTQKRPELIRVEPVLQPEAAELEYDLKEGHFDLVGTSKYDTVGTGAGHILLLRLWRTDKYYTYNQLTGQINKLHDNRREVRKKSSDRFYQVLPDITNWNYSLDESNNYYKKYLIQDDIENLLHQREVTRIRRNTHSFPDFEPLQPLPPLYRPPSFTSDIGPERDSYYRRYLQETVPYKSLTDRPARLTRSNVLRHEFEVSRRPQSPVTLFSEMSQTKQPRFDTDDALQEKNLKCPVCKHYYDTKDRNPHVLHCLHSTCHSCLKSRVRAEMVQCPVCSEVHEVPNNEIEQLPVDHARQHLVKYYKAKYRTQEVGCDSCDPRNRASHRCKECDEFMCGVCTEAHKRTKVTKGHTVVNVEALKRASLDEFHHKRTCPVPGHEDQHFSFYCYSKDCDKPICSLCAVTDHNKADGHDIRNINDVYVENKRIVEGMVIDVKHKRGLADEAIQSIEDEIQNLYIKENSTEEDLDQAFLACQKQLEKRKNELKEKLAATSKAKKKGMESQLDKLIGEKNSLDHAAKFSTNVLGYSDTTEFLQMKDALFGRLSELNELDVDTRPHNKADIKFHGHKMIDNFQKFSNKMGEVWSTTAFIPHTKIQTYDIGLGREETAMMITLHDYERRPLAEPGVDIRVEVTNPTGLKTRANVLDLTDSEGAYKVVFQGSKLGDHRASVFVMGMPVIDPGVIFKVRRQNDLEQDIIRDYDPISEAPRVKAKVDSGLKSDSEDLDMDQNKARTKSYRVFGDIICPDFMYDAQTCHPQNSVSTDNRILKNIRGRTAHIGTALKNYRGVIGSRPFTKMGRFYFEVVVYFAINRQLRNDLIFEVALARKPEVDKNYTVDGSMYAWTICARRCAVDRTVCLMAFHNGVRQYHTPLTENAPPGTTLRTTLGFLVDVKQKQWFIVDARNRRLFFVFKNIDTSKPLWPVFGAYSTEYVSVSMTLKTGKDVQAVPDIPTNI